MLLSYTGFNQSYSKKSRNNIMLNKLSFLARKSFLPIIILIIIGWFAGDFIIERLPSSARNSIEDNIIIPIQKISTNCPALNEEIKTDEQCRWSLNCTMSRNEQAAYQKRKLKYETFCEIK